MCRAVFIFLALTFFNISMFAAQNYVKFEPVACKDAMGVAAKRGKQYIIDNHRDRAVFPSLKEAVEDVADIAFKLGYSVPDHVLTFGPSNELAMLVANGGHAAPHWIDGQKIVESRINANSVLEFVTDGCPMCHSYYQDTTSFIHQISILMHVAGHNDFGKNSRFDTIRSPNDSSRFSYEMFDYMISLKIREGLDWSEVVDFYQLMYSLKYDQDLVVGSYESVDSIKEKLNAELTSGKKHAPTASLMQAYIAATENTMKTWQKDLLRIFEQRESWIGGAAQTKIINEGWATFSMYLLAKHSKYNSISDGIDFGNLLAGVLGTKKNNPADMLGNPYWLGFEGWSNLYKDFRKNYGLVKDELSFDRDFVTYAHKEIISSHSDFEFIRKSLNEKWMAEKGLVLTRELNYMDPEFDFEKIKAAGDKLFVLLSNKGERLIRQIARRYGDKGRIWPRVLFVEQNHAGRYILMRHDIEMSSGVPLELSSAAMKLYGMATKAKKSVALDTSVPVRYLDRGGEQIYVEQMKKLKENAWWFPVGYQPTPDISLLTLPVRIIVHPDGKSEVRVWNEDKKLGDSNVEIETYVDQQIAIYKEDLAVGRDDLYELKREKGFTQLLDATIDSSISSVSGLVTSAPTASSAVREYTEYLKARTARAIKRALEGKGELRATNSGMQVRVLPVIPNFTLDRMYVNLRMNASKRAPIDFKGDNSDPFLDDNTHIMAIDGMPGDVYRKPAPQKGKGKGQGEESDEEGDGDPSPGKGKGGKDPNFVTIPWEQWIDYISETFQLKNIRKTDGRSLKASSKRGASMIVDKDPLRDEVNIKKAYVYGIQVKTLELEAKYQGVEFKELTELEKADRIQNELEDTPEEDILELGFAYFPREELVSYGRIPQNRPQFDAVVVIGIDFSYSMFGDPLERAKRTALNIKHILKKHYDYIEFRYVVFDTKAHEVSEEKAWSVAGGGGTSYHEGVRLMNKVTDEYPASKFNRYSYIFGDSGDNFSPELSLELSKMIEKTDASGYIKTGEWGLDEFDEGIVKMQSSAKEKFSVTRWTEKGGNMIEAIKDLFSSEGKKK